METKNIEIGPNSNKSNLVLQWTIKIKMTSHPTLPTLSSGMRVLPGTAEKCESIQLE